MPTNRRPLQRLRHPAFTPSVLKLFAELEAMPRRRRSEAYTRKSKELARLLDLTAEWWGMNDVNMRATRPSHPPGYASHDGFFRVKAIRELLLAAIKDQNAAAPVQQPGGVTRPALAGRCRSRCARIPPPCARSAAADGVRPRPWPTSR